ncbi:MULTISPECIES: hypothetical protein [Saccharothrix]|uniref:hypothetical protein n=1 Tax=Saccharothrix TaxID=2071 RepID=UPI0027D26EFD|nr:MULTISPECIES: hypothetical protein [Saccharothrix]MDU0294859.1 hypothetical protein [Saccharothrix longispora]
MREQLIIVGAGPAGLAAAHAARDMDPLVLEGGPALDRRDHGDTQEAAQGVGGAGLFSDGKFSFWPSASNLWTLHGPSLRGAYAWFRHQLHLVGITTPPLSVDKRHVPLGGGSGQKRYPSVYSDLDSRRVLIKQLHERVARVQSESPVSQAERFPGGWRVVLRTGEVLTTRRLLLATGRLGPLQAGDWIDRRHLTFRRIEVGVRIEEPSESFFLSAHPQVDPKYIWRDGPVEWRTFCCCRDGEIIGTSTNGVTSASGRSDGPGTGRSNVGFNVRLDAAWEESLEGARFFATVRRARRLRRCLLGRFIRDAGSAVDNDLSAVLGRGLTTLLAKGLDRLVATFPDHDFLDALLTGPTIEGVGLYPVHDERLASPMGRLWCAGDVAGDFRGLTAALVSGHIAGQSAAGYRGALDE